MYTIREIDKSFSRQALESKAHQFKSYLLLNRKPVKFTKHRSDLVELASKRYFILAAVFCILCIDGVEMWLLRLVYYCSSQV